MIIPKDNEKDLKDIPAKVLKDIKIIPVEQVDKVLMEALEIDSADKIFKTLHETWPNKDSFSKKKSSSIRVP